MRTDYQLKNGATIEDFLTAATTVWSFEGTERGYELLVAMRELLFSIRNAIGDDHRMDIGDAHRIETLEDSFLELFRLWLGATGHKVPMLIEPTLEDAFTLLFGLSVTVDPE